MALLIEETVDVTAHVIAGVVDIYSARRERVQSIPLTELLSGGISPDLASVNTVVAADLRTVEIIADAHLDLERLAAASWLLSGRGWDITVLVPCNRIGDAHASLRAAPCRLQPWWFDEHGIWFGAPEIP